MSLNFICLKSDDSLKMWFMTSIICILLPIFILLCFLFHKTDYTVENYEC